MISLLILASLGIQASALLPRRSILPRMATTDDIKIAEFPQLIDHGNPSLGTFQQKYYYQAASWKGPGSPIILFASGENNASDTSGLIVSEFGTYGVLAEQIGAAAIALEHRVSASTEESPAALSRASFALCQGFASLSNLDFSSYG